MKPASASTPSRGDHTREALITAAIGIFGRDGFHASSTRAIAEAANANQALIGYHFGGKQGLYEAVFAHIAQQAMQHLGPIVERVEALLDTPGEVAQATDRRERYFEPLLQLVNGMVALIASEQAAAWAQLIVREQMTPGPAFDVLYQGFIGRVLGLLGRLVERLRGHDRDAPAADARLLVATVLGQIVVFRAARAGVMQLMGWTAIGPAELKAIQQRLRENLIKQLLPPESDR